MAPKRLRSTNLILGLCSFAVLMLALGYFPIPAFVIDAMNMLVPINFNPFKPIGWTRIGVSSEEDAKRLYPLILEYLQNPRKARSVKEFVFQYPRQVGTELEGLDVFKILADAELRDGISPDPLIAKAIEKFSLGVTYRTAEGVRLKSNHTSDWVHAITWMNPDLWELRQEIFTRDEKLLFFSHNESYTFVQYAVALLVALCPNIEVILWQDGTRNDLLEHILWHNNYGGLPKPFLQKLRRIRFLPNPNPTAVDNGEMDDVDLYSASAEDHGYYIYMDLLGKAMAVHRLPSMETMVIEGVDDGSDGVRNGAFLMPPGTSSIKKLHLEHTMFSSSFLSLLIRMPRKLEHFTCTSGGRAVRGPENWRYPKTLGKALLCHKDTLQSLDLDLDEYLIHSTDGLGEEDDVDSWLRKPESDEQLKLNERFQQDLNISSGPLLTVDLPDTREYNNTIGSLHDFSKLTRLSINVRLLLGWRKSPELPYSVPFRLVDALPSKLKYLTIRGYERGVESVWDAQIEDFVAKRVKRYPLLKEVHGIDSPVLNGKSVERPQVDRDQLWTWEPVNTTWF